MASVTSQLYRFMKEGKNEEAISTIKSIEPNRLFQYDRDLLHRALEYGNTVMAEYLIDNGWDLDAKNAHGKTLLEVAWERKKKDMNCMLYSRILNAMKINNSFINKQIKLTQPKWPNDLQIIYRLLHHLTRECFNRKQIAEELLQLGCPMAAAVCVFKDATLTKWMFYRDCPVDGRLISTGETALHLAVEYFDVDNVRLLLEHGAKVDATDKMGFTPISRINIDNSDKCVEILKLLLEHGASLTGTFSKRRSSGCHPDGPIKIVDKILRRGDEKILRVVIPYIDLRHKDTDGYTPLHHLIYSRYNNSLEVLRGKSVDANVPDNTGWTPRDVAVSVMSYEKVRFLLEHGASPNNFDHDGDVAVRRLLWDVSESEKAKNVFELLLLYNMNFDLLIRSGEIMFALKFAMENLDFAKLVLAHLAKLESLGVFLYPSFTEKIKLNEDLQNYFNACKRQIEEMKGRKLYEAVTLYKLLTEDQKRLTMYARNEEFQLHYESFKSNKYFIYPYYMKSITFRVDRAIALANMKNKAADFICQVTSLPKSLVVTIAYVIVDYLSQNDIENVIKISSSVRKIKNDNGKCDCYRSN